MANYYSSLTAQQIEAALKIAKKIGTINGAIKSNGSGSDSGISADSTGEHTTNKVTSITQSSTNTQYPSAKAVWDLVQQGGGGGNVFVASYGYTTHAEIFDAILSGAIIIVDTDELFTDDPTIGYYVGMNTNYEYVFVSIGNGKCWVRSVNTDDEWTSEAIVFEDTDNKVTSITQSSTNTQYPSAKAVWDLVQQGGGGDNIFVARYDVTSRADILDAVSAGKFVMAVRSTYSVSYPQIGVLYGFDGTNAPQFVRFGMLFDQLTYTFWTVEANGWQATSATSLTRTSDKRFAIDSSSTDETYPSSKAVWNLFQSMGDKVFVATYDVTTYDEITQAIDDGKIIFVNKPSDSSGPQFGVYIGEGFGHMFSVVGNGGYYLIDVMSDDTWEADNFRNFVYKNEIVTAINASSTDQKIPSAKAVWNLVQASGAVVVQYGNATFAQLLTYHNAHRPVIVYKTDSSTPPYTYYGILTQINTNVAFIHAFHANQGKYEVWTVAAAGWSASEYQLETVSNKASAITSSSTNTQYPGAKAVWDLVSPLQSELNGVNALFGTGVI